MHFPELSNFSVEASVQHLVFLTGSCLLALDKTQAGVFSISWFLVTFFTKRKTAINLEPVMISIWNLDYIILTREIQQPKNLNDDAMSAIHDFIFFFLVYDKFLAIHKFLDIWSIILELLLITTFDLTTAANTDKKSSTQLSLYWFEQRHYSCLKVFTFCKIIWHQQNLGESGTIRYIF